MTVDNRVSRPILVLIELLPLVNIAKFLEQILFVIYMLFTAFLQKLIVLNIVFITNSIHFILYCYVAQWERRVTKCFTVQYLVRWGSKSMQNGIT